MQCRTEKWKVKRSKQPCRANTEWPMAMRTYMSVLRSQAAGSLVAEAHVTRVGRRSDDLGVSQSPGEKIDGCRPTKQPLRRGYRRAHTDRPRNFEEPRRNAGCPGKRKERKMSIPRLLTGTDGNPALRITTFFYSSRENTYRIASVSSFLLMAFAVGAKLCRKIVRE